MVGPSWALPCGAAGNVTHTSNAPSARTAAMRGFGCRLVELGIMGTRILNAFDLRFRYWFGFSLLLLGLGFPAGGAGLLGAPPVAELASLSSSLVACAATWAMFSVMSCF